MLHQIRKEQQDGKQISNHPSESSFHAQQQVKVATIAKQHESKMVRRVLKSEPAYSLQLT